MSLIGLDIGTTGCKAIVFSSEGKILGQGAREYAILTPHPNWAEQDAEQVWGLAWDALREAVATAGDDPPRAMALSCHTPCWMRWPACRGRAAAPCLPQGAYGYPSKRCS